MPRKPDDDVASWHGLRDQLTPQQIAKLTEAERAGTDAANLLDLARHYAGQHPGDTWHVDVAAPFGAAYCGHWDQDTDGRWSRGFDGTTRLSGGTAVVIRGLQDADGTVERHVSIGAAKLTTWQARQLAAALINAADEIDQFDGEWPQR